MERFSRYVQADRESHLYVIATQGEGMDGMNVLCIRNIILVDASGTALKLTESRQELESRIVQGERYLHQAEIVTAKHIAVKY